MRRRLYFYALWTNMQKGVVNSSIYAPAQVLRNARKKPLLFFVHITKAYRNYVLNSFIELELMSPRLN